MAVARSSSQVQLLTRRLACGPSPRVRSDRRVVEDLGVPYTRTALTYSPLSSLNLEDEKLAMPARENSAQIVFK